MMLSGVASARASARNLLNLATAARQCLSHTSESASKLALSRYILRNLATRLGLHSIQEEEICFDFVDVRLSIRSSQGELYLYKEIFLDNVYARHPGFQLRLGWCVFDVGANIGVFALKAAREVGHGKVYAFEPNPQTYPRLLRNLELNHARNVFPLQAAIGCHTGTARFDPARASTIARLVDSCSSAPRVAVDVSVLTLSDVIQQERILVVNLVKLDVEGEEAEVLRGAGQALQKIERIVMEYHSDRLLNECAGLLTPFGFRQVALAPPAYAYFSRVS